MAEYLDNPAGRLHRLLVRFCQNASDAPVWHTWATVFGISTSSPIDVARNIGLLLHLPDEIESELALLNPTVYDRDMVLRWKTILPALGPPLFANQTSKQIAGKFDSASLGSLEHCSWTLHKYGRYQRFGSSEFQRINELLADLQTVLHQSSDIDPELKQFLLLNCDQMQRALRDSVIRGPAALDDFLNRTADALVRREELTARRDSDPTVWQKFVAAVKEITVILGAASALASLPIQVRQAIEGPSTSPPAQIQVIVEEEPPQQNVLPSTVIYTHRASGAETGSVHQGPTP